MSEWIDVKEELPLENVISCLVYLNGHGVHIRHYACGKFFKSWYDAWMTWNLKKNKIPPMYKIKKPLSSVTHWMLLPSRPLKKEPPKDPANE